MCVSLLAVVAFTVAMLGEFEGEGKALVMCASRPQSPGGGDAFLREAEVGSLFDSSRSVSPKCQSAGGHSNKSEQDLGLTGFPKAPFCFDVASTFGEAAIPTFSHCQF